MTVESNDVTAITTSWSHNTIKKSRYKSFIEQFSNDCRK